GGRVLDREGRTVPQLYATGWIKRGASGTVGTNRGCGVETAEKIIADLHTGNANESKPGFERLRELLALRHARPLSYADWERIDAAELLRGRQGDKPREKFTTTTAMIAALDAALIRSPGDGTQENQSINIEGRV
ncbi:MAG: hypothetical protein ACTS5I_17920, partial [Rhodanobacter sp.]